MSMSTPSRYTPRLYASPGPLSQSLSCSPFTGLLLPLSPSPGSTVVSSGHGRFDFETDDNTSGKEGCEDGLTCNDSLGILSTVALYHSEQSGGESKREEGMNGSQETSGITTSVGDGMARMKLESSSGKKYTKILNFDLSMIFHSRHNIECSRRQTIHSTPSSLSPLLFHHGQG